MWIGSDYQRPHSHTHFSKRSAHWFCPFLPVTPGHWPQPRVMPRLSNGLGSSMQKTPFGNSLRFSCTPKVLTPWSFASYSQDHLKKLKWPETKLAGKDKAGFSPCQVVTMKVSFHIFQVALWLYALFLIIYHYIDNIYHINLLLTFELLFEPPILILHKCLKLICYIFYLR